MKSKRVGIGTIGLMYAVGNGLSCNYSIIPRYLLYNIRSNEEIQDKSSQNNRFLNVV